MSLSVAHSNAMSSNALGSTTGPWGLSDGVPPEVIPIVRHAAPRQRSGRPISRSPRDIRCGAGLSRALEGKLIASEGTGRKRDPFRYWLPQREEVWKQDPLYQLRIEMAEQRRRLKL